MSLCSRVKGLAFRPVWIVAVAIYLAHLALLLWVDRAFPLLYSSVALFAIFGLVAWRRPVFHNLWLAYAGAIAFEVAAYSGAWGFFTWVLILAGFLPPILLVERVARAWRLVLWGFWIGLMIYTTGGSATFRSIQNFWADGAVATPLLVFVFLTSLMGAQFAVSMGFAGYLNNRLRLGPLPLVFCLVYLVVEYWIPFPFPNQPCFMIARTPVLIQIVDLIGSRGITLVCLLTAGALYTLVSPVARANMTMRARRAWVVVLIAAPLFQLGYGLVRMQMLAPRPGDKSIDIAMIQPCSPLHILNKDRDEKLKVASNLLAMSREAMKPTKPDMLIWPEGEAAMQYLPPQVPASESFNSEYLEAVRVLQSESAPTLLLSDVAFERPSEDTPAGQGMKYHYLNHVTFVGDDGSVKGGYTKLIRLPFAEYLPFEQALLRHRDNPFLMRLHTLLRKAFPATRSVGTGSGYTIFYGPHDAPFATTICYESIFENHVRECVRAGAKYMVNLANEGWLGSEAIRRHSMLVGMIRTVENRVPFVRATNSGISILSDARGVILAQAPDGEKAVIRGKVTPGPARSVYLSFGYLAAKWVFTPMLLAFWAYGAAVNRKRRRQSAEIRGLHVPPSARQTRK